VNNDNKQLTIFDSQPIAEWRPVRDDFNFCRLALFVSADTKADRFRNIRQTFEIQHEGKALQVIWEVRHDAELGLPTSFDRDVWLGIMDLVQEATDGGKKPIPDVIEIPSITQFLKRIGKKSDGGSGTLRLKESIRRLSYTTCVTERAFKCPSSGGYLSLVEPIRLIEKCAFRGDSAGEGKVQERTWLSLGEYVRKNLDSGYIALLDVRYVQTMKSELAKQLYSYLSYRFWLAVQRGRDYTSEHWQDLAAYLAASGWNNLPRAKQRLAAALKELKRTQYIDDSSDWNSDFYVFKVGEKFIDELRNRLKAREQYQAWISGKSNVRQLTVIPRPIPVNTPITENDEKESALIRQAIRMAICHQQPNAEILSRYGWTPQDAESLASRLKANSTATLLKS
jgi:hypothetical protein